MSESILLGVEQLVNHVDEKLRGRQIGLVTNDVATIGLTRDKTLPPLMSTRTALLQAGIQVTTLFSPEHGLGSDAADGSRIADMTDSLTGLPVYSLYGKSYRPGSAQLAGLDGILFDIPDIGARFYTYIWTLSYVMEVCAEEGVPVWILDRPNPLGGDLDLAEGPLLNEATVSSFVGRWSMPVRHCLTVGELAQLWNTERNMNVMLNIVPVKGWQRTSQWPATKLPFIPTSPNLPSYETALLYPGTCLFEGTNLSEGRGTSMPFRVVGAPWLNHYDVADAFNELTLDGIVARAVHFIPAASKYSHEACQGIMLHVTDPNRVRPVAAGLHLLSLIIDLNPAQFEWLPYPTSVNESGYGHFDRLIGRLDVRPALSLRAEDRRRQIEDWTSIGDWRQRTTPHLLY